MACYDPQHKHATHDNDHHVCTTGRFPWTSSTSAWYNGSLGAPRGCEGGSDGFRGVPRGSEGGFHAYLYTATTDHHK